MSKAKTAVNNAVTIANSSAHGYDQGSRWGPDYDCSSLVIESWERAGVPVKSRGATYTGNMFPVFTGCGFVNVKSEVNIYTGAGMLPGDVLLNVVHHAAMYIGNGQIVQASHNEKGGITGGMPGDQTGSEISVMPYYLFSYGWDYVLRYVESGNKEETGQETTMAASTAEIGDDGCYTVKSGDSLWGIAQKTLGSGARYREIMDLNNMSSSTIHAGDILKIPGKWEQTSTTSSGSSVSSKPTHTPARESEASSLVDGVYVVQQGDTLWGIALKYLGNGMRYKEIQKLNGLGSHIIHVGERLKLPDK